MADEEEQQEQEAEAAPAPAAAVSDAPPLPPQPLATPAAAKKGPPPPPRVRADGSRGSAGGASPPATPADAEEPQKQRPFSPELLGASAACTETRGRLEGMGGGVGGVMRWTVVALCVAFAPLLLGDSGSLRPAVVGG
jgi:hypothetical protein